MGNGPGNWEETKLSVAVSFKFPETEEEEEEEKEAHGSEKDKLDKRFIWEIKCALVSGSWIQTAQVSANLTKTFKFDGFQRVVSRPTTLFEILLIEKD